MVLPLAETATRTPPCCSKRGVFREAFEIEGHTLRVSFKSGIARYAGVGEDGNTLVQRAEAALKQAKTSGEQYLHYQIQMHSELAERLSLEHRLRAALDEEQFVLFYQPQVNVVTGLIDGVEALLRWQDPQEGLVAPARFLPVLESSGMIVPVGDWVLRKAADDCRRWQRLGLGPVRVAVNVSALQVRRRTFVDSVLKAATGWAHEGYGVDIEITETGLLQDLEGTSRKLRELRSEGLRIAIDDFGTGYSSLGLLSKLPVDLLKIDRAFISGLPADRASVTLVSSIISLASAFNLTLDRRRRRDDRPARSAPQPSLRSIAGLPAFPPDSRESARSVARPSASHGSRPAIDLIDRRRDTRLPARGSSRALPKLFPESPDIPSTYRRCLGPCRVRGLNVEFGGCTGSNVTGRCARTAARSTSRRRSRTYTSAAGDRRPSCDWNGSVMRERSRSRTSTDSWRSCCRIEVESRCCAHRYAAASRRRWK